MECDRVRICIPLMSSKGSICHSTCLFPPLCPPCHVAPNSVLWMRRERNEPLQSIYAAEELSAHFHKLPFPHRINHRLRKIFLDPKLCHLREGLMQARSKCLLPSPVSPNLYFFFLISVSGVLKLPLWKPRLPQSLFICASLLRSSPGLLGHSQERLAVVHRSLQCP